ncbi:MAG: SPOR domain-containing protein [Deltaproteobacteria bacterium]|nr:SPOR domain-containing protein [Deltaproteobacteria bacterium]
MTGNSFNPGIFLRVAVKRWVTIVFVIGACLGLSGIYAAWKALRPVYTSSCSIRFEPDRGSDDFINRLLSTPSDNIETQQAIMLSHDFLKGVVAKLSLIDPENPEADPGINPVIEDLRSKISIEREGKTDILCIRVLDKDPDLALKLAETFSSTFVTSYREAHDKRIDEVIAHINEEQRTTDDKLRVKEGEYERFIKENRLVSIDLEGEALLVKKNEIEEKVQKSSRALEPELEKVNENIDLHMDKKIEFDRLKMEVESLRNIASFLEEKRQEAMIRRAENPDYIRVVSPAQRASRSINEPDYLKIPLTGLIAGIILGLILVIIIEAIDHSAALIEKLENGLKVRVIGVIPTVEQKDLYQGIPDSGKREGAVLSPEQFITLVTHFAPGTLMSESFRGLRANIQAILHEGRIKTIAVAGSYPGEGRSTVAANLSISLAQAGLRTLLVGSDLTNPDLSARFFLDESPGLTNILLGTSQWEEIVKTVTEMIIGGMTLDQVIITPGLDKLNIITRGAIPDKQAELLGTKGFSGFLDEVKSAYDIVILDSSPVLSSADAATLAAKVDGTIVVYNPSQVSMRALKRTIAQLSRVSSNIIGITLNCVRPGLIPRALREKYAGADMRDTEVHAPVKKKSLLKVLLPLVAIIIIMAVLWWQRGAIFPERPEIKEIKKAPETPVEVKQQGPERPKAKLDELDVPDSMADVKAPVEKKATPEKIAEKQPDITPEPPAETETEMIYQEGRFPYSVYLGSFNSTEQAGRAIDHYAKSGIASFWVKVNLGEKGIWYRVYSGEFADKADAEAYINEKAIKDGEIKKSAYAVYAGSFTDREALEGMINILKENCYAPYIIADENFDSLLTGAFITKAGADELSAELNALGISNRVVLR